jgi:8-oxo-dGTP pyrophosphatase MutT (NUDIX family)
MSEPPSSWILQVRQRLASPPPSRLPPDEGRQAAVLVPLYVDAGQLWTVLTRRTDDLPHHRGQIAFPGGGRETGEEPWETALRETEEEIGLDPKRVLRLGELDEAATPSGYRIVPCVGAVPHPLEAKPDGVEIAEIFSAPLLAFANVRMAEEREVTVNGRTRTLRVYHVAGGRQVWGLTARLIQNLMERLGMGGLPTEAG